MNFHYVAIAYDAQKILKSVTFIETQKSRYLENKTLFFLQTKKFINYTSRVTLFQKKKNSFVAEVTLNTISDKANQKDLCGTHTDIQVSFSFPFGKKSNIETSGRLNQQLQ